MAGHQYLHGAEFARSSPSYEGRSAIPFTAGPQVWQPPAAQYQQIRGQSTEHPVGAAAIPNYDGSQGGYPHPTSPTNASHSRYAPPPSTAGALKTLARSLRGRVPGETVYLPAPVVINGHEARTVVIEKDMKSASGALLIRLLPGNGRYILKYEDVHQEAAITCALKHANSIWRQHSITFFGVPVEATTYEIIPLGREAGLVQVVEGAQTLRELRHVYGNNEENRVTRYLMGDHQRLERLAASVVAFMTACYVLGIRDGHDDNLMIHTDGRLFRIDFGFAFGASPAGLDAPDVFISRAVAVALGEERWNAVLNLCIHAIQALGEMPVGSHLLRGTSELAPMLPNAWVHAQTLSVSDFAAKIGAAIDWKPQRALKNTWRDAWRYIWAEEDEEEEEQTPQSRQSPSSRQVAYSRAISNSSPWQGSPNMVRQDQAMNYGGTQPVVAPYGNTMPYGNVAGPQNAWRR